MSRFNDIPLRWRLVVATLITCAIAQLLAGVVMAFYDGQAYRTQKAQEVASQAAILGASMSAALSFDDVKAANEFLNSLQANPAIDAAAVFRAGGGRLAGYVRNASDASSLPSTAEPPGQRYEGTALIVYSPVTEGGTVLGTVYLRASTEPLVLRLARYSGILVLTVAACLCIAVPISIRLNASISQPIAGIAAAATRISEGDLSLTVIASSRRDEVGRLQSAFSRMVESLREMTGDLERLVARRTLQLEETNKELEAFSYSVSHDLRAPLRAIDGYGRMLEEDYADKLDDEGNRMLAVVRKSSRTMGALIDSLLAFSKLGRQAIHMAGIDMTMLAREVWSELEMGAEQATAFHLSDLPAAHGDRQLVKQVWVNLLSNARKYSGNRDEPAVDVSGALNGDEIVYSVRDNGAGFDMKYYDKLFGVFQRLHTTDEFSGTGVGLAIVQRIVSRHGGRAWAEGKVGEGATFFFALPVAPAPGAELSGDRKA